MLLRRSLLGLGGLLAAVLLALIGSSAVRADDPPAPTEITQGSLNWGIKASFRRYVGDAEITVSGGVTRTGDATAEFPVPGFTWPLESGTYDPATKSTTLQFAGTVHFSGHDGALDMTVSAPKLVLTGAESTLYADVLSRPLDGSPVKDYGVVPVGALDLSGQEPTVEATTTTWPALPTYLAAEGAPAFAGFYPVNTQMDPVSVTYTGPGGKAPVTVETWDKPGTVTFDKVATNSAIQATSIFPDAAHGVIHVIENQTGQIHALDATTLQPVGTPATLAVPENISTSRSAFDRETGSLFVKSGSAVHQLTWDGTTKTYADTTLPGAAVTSAFYGEDMAYNADAKLLVHLASGQLATWTRTWAGWTRKDFTVSASGTAIDVDDQGVVIVTGAGSKPQQINVSGDTATTANLPGSFTDPQAVQPGQYDQPSQVRIGADGTAYLTSYLGRTWTVRKNTSGLYAATKDAAAPAVGNVFNAAIDPTDQLYVGTAQGGNSVLSFWNGAYVGALRVPTLGFPNNFPYPYIGIGIDLDHTLYTSSSDATTGGLLKFQRVGFTPTVTTQPTAATVTLGVGETTEDATFTAAATGTPAPTVQWQSRTGDTGRWTDIAGKTGATLTLPSTVSDSGLQVRAVFTNAAGALATDAAALTVEAAPAVVAQPDPQTALVGDDATFQVMPSGNPYPDIQWQRRDSSGFWVDLDEATTGTLVIEDTTLAMAGTELRARLRNRLGTVYSRTVKLTVQERVSGPVGVVGGGLDWGIKASFRTYIRGPIATGDYTTAGGASENSDGTIHFPATGGSFDAASGETTVQLGGSVHFTGHAGALDMTVTEPRVVFDGEGAGTLYADVVSKSLDGAALVSYPDVAFAALDPSAVSAVPGTDAMSWTGIPAALTAAGAPAFASFYPVGQVLDPLNLSITTGGPVGEDPGEDPGADPGTGGGSGGGGSSTPAASTDAPTTAVPVQTDAPSADPTPTAPATVTPAAPAGGPSVKTAAKQVRVGTSRTVSVASVACAAGPCRVVVPKSVRVRIGGKLFTVEVSAPATLKTGETGSVRIVLPKAALKALRGHKVSAKVRVVVLAADERAVATVHPTVTA
jgi:hypothetical protein